jgi:ethanolamine utilization protein EutA
MKELNMNYQLGDIISEKDVRTLAREYAKTLLEVIRGPATSKKAKLLMMTESLDFSIPIDEISFSGGVAEMIYGNDKGYTEYNDIGKYLAEEINIVLQDLNLSVIEPKNKIRATVIGAGSYSLSVSGSTCFFDENIELPLNNIPVVPVNISSKNLSPEHIKDEITRAFQNFNINEGEDLFALYFMDPLNYPFRIQSDRMLSIFTKGIESSLPNSVANKKLIIIILGIDGAKVLGIKIRRETLIQDSLICLDELSLEAGDWIDIGAPLNPPPHQAFPVTIKSLVFSPRKDSS